MRRIRLTLSYDGTGFYGWQKQPGLATIQGTLEQAVSEIEGAPVHVAGSGRTDAGVHAVAQVAAISIENPIPLPNLKKALNRLLPCGIRVTAVDDVPPDFHPRYHALAKTYEYRIVRTEVCSPFERHYAYHHPYPLDTARMLELAPMLEGEHDFTAFAASDERDALGLSKIRTIFRSELEEVDDRLIYRVRGSGFLKHMVRNIVGTLLEAGKGNLDSEGLRTLLRSRGRTGCGPTAPARGLFLISVEYQM
ncbi:MAG TPA: tRNA pseudouridine(38-40) synthase TruA [Bryobacteraceae bacterium]|nr:tRNA pseudouridine(38-40) synthase TruA [Bryobacteraceae bacterium]